MKPLILASTSPYRRELLARLGWPFEAKSPAFDEESEKKKAPKDPAGHAAYLAHGKATSLAAPGVVVIGGDQLVHFENQILGKAGRPDKAVDQLMMMAGKTHELLTAVCVVNGAEKREWVHRTRLHLRNLSRAQFENYVKMDQAWDTAGSYKFEKHGLLLFDKIDCDDSSAIQGLPLIELGKVLIDFGFVPFSIQGHANETPQKENKGSK